MIMKTFPSHGSLFNAVRGSGVGILSERVTVASSQCNGENEHGAQWSSKRDGLRGTFGSFPHMNKEYQTACSRSISHQSNASNSLIIICQEYHNNLITACCCLAVHPVFALHVFAPFLPPFAPLPIAASLFFLSFSSISLNRSFSAASFSSFSAFFLAALLFPLLSYQCQPCQVCSRLVCLAFSVQFLVAFFRLLSL